MKADIITIGDEILIGQVVDTNSAFIAEELNSNGIQIRKIHSIPDLAGDITSTLDESIQSSDLVILTGGIGPTNDDITKKALASYFDSKLVVHEKSLEHIKKRFSGMKIELSDRNIKQAEVPEICEVLPNRNGSAPAMVFRKEDKIIISLPGVPFEMKTIVQEEVIPLLNKAFQLPVRIQKTVLTVGIPESTMADRLKSWEESLSSNLNFAYLPSPGLLRLRLSISGEDKKRMHKRLDDKTTELVQIIGEKHVFGFDKDTLAGVVGRLLNEKSLTLSVAESCTGGNIAHLVTSVPGSSVYFKGSVTAYANEIKTQIIGVKETDINSFGAVSEPVVQQMASGIKKIFKTDYSIATSGIAGPDGGTPEKPVGITWIAIGTPDKLISRKYLLGDHRERNITKASLIALNMLRNSLL